MTIVERAPAAEGADRGEGRERPKVVRREGTAAGRAIATGLGALLLAVLLCADSLERTAERQRFGTGRDIALDVIRPLRATSHALGLHLPRLWLAELTGNEDPPVSPPAGADISVPSATVPAKAAAPTPTVPAAGTPKPVLVIPPPAPPPLPPRRVPTAEAPVRVWMGGDSLMGNISAAFGRLTRGDPRVAIAADFHVSTGLARPDVFDWPAYLHGQLEALQPEVVYLAFGANDDQDMIRPDGARVVLGSPEWRDEYARRVALVMDVAAQGDRTVVWIGLPPERPERLQWAKDIMNGVAREQAGLRPRVHFVDTVPVFSPDGSGAYTDLAVAPDGSVVRAREGDGVHLTHAGSDILAHFLFAAIAAEWSLG